MLSVAERFGHRFGGDPGARKESERFIEARFLQRRY
jgi:hypothetical protein